MLQRHMLEYEAIYTADTSPFALVDGEAIFITDFVHVLRMQKEWMREKSRVMLPNEEPCKVLKTQKFNWKTKSLIENIPVELFGQWQTKFYTIPLILSVP